MQIRTRFSISADGYVTTPEGWPAPTNDRWPWPDLDVFVLGSEVSTAGAQAPIVTDADPQRLLDKLRAANRGAQRAVADRADAARRRRPEHRGDRSAFFVPEATMAQRISRAKATIRSDARAAVRRHAGRTAAPSAGQTDWREITALYELLERIASNPMFTLNRVVAVAMLSGPAAGLELLAAVEGDDRLTAGHRLPAVRGHLLELAGDPAGAAEAYAAAAHLTTSLPERDYLQSQAVAARAAAAVAVRRTAPPG